MSVKTIAPPAATDSNEQISQEIRRRFIASPYRELRHIGVMVDDAQIELRGAVPSYVIKQLAQETSRTVSVGRKINNRLEVR